MKTEYCDIGLNLFSKQFRDPEEIMRGAHEAGVQFIITGSDMRSSEQAAEFVRSHDCYATAGIHPHEADSVDESSFKRLAELYGQERVVAVGECGLDYDRMFSSREDQLSCLRRHIDLAEQTGLPMFLHEREASDDLVSCFEGHSALCERSVVHCFTGDAKTAERYLSMGFYIGVTGWICDDRRADALREAVRHIPLDRIMAETDAPYLTPRGIKGLGRVNLPQNVRYVVSALAGYMNVTEQELKARLSENTERFFGISLQRNGV
ncbi:MAG: TatD family hydrolase [Ruminococcus sp.]|nr:TatD family hydrolase [Ruminococcus sp.]